MTRMQVLLEKKELTALQQQARLTGKSYSQLVREAVDNTFTSRFTQEDIARMAEEARQGKGTRRFRSLAAARSYLWSL